MDLRDYLKVLRRRWRLVVACLLLAVAAGSVLTLRTTPQYTSTTQLFISTAQSDSAEAYQGGLFSQQRVTSYADLVSGDEVAQRVVDSLGLAVTAQDLSSQIDATVVPETVLLNVAVTDPDPERAGVLADTVADEFADFVAELETPPGRNAAAIKATTVDPAVAATTPTTPQPLRNIGLAAVLGLLVGVGAAVLRETLDQSVRSPEDLTALTGAPMIGTVPYDSAAVKEPLITTLTSHAPRLEAFRVMRTNLQFVSVDSDNKVFVVTSCTPGEGKTTTACNMAITLSQSGQRVVLVEGDLRRPRVAEYLRLEAAVGLTTVLIGRLDLEDSYQQGPDGLTALTSGAVPPNPSELLQSSAMADALKRLREEFDVVLIDAPPLLPVTDAAVLTSQADGALLVVRHGETTRDEVRHSVERLDAVGGRHIGSVLNRTPTSGKRYGYGYGYGYAPDPGARKGDRSSKSRKAQADDAGISLLP